MKILVAPQAFKGSFSSIEVAHAIEKGILDADPNADVTLMPISDGGDGFLDALLGNGKRNRAEVKGPQGESFEVEWGMNERGEALIESAKICGLHLSKTDPMHATSFGVGEMIRIAIDHGVKRIMIGIGGTATHDLGIGLVQALGGKFLDHSGHNVSFGGEGLSKIEKVDFEHLHKGLSEVEIVAVCDVTNPLCGSEGAAHTYAPQKGADESMVKQLEAATCRFLEIIGDEYAEEECVGAGGGLAFGLKRFLGAKLCRGSAYVLTEKEFLKEAKNAEIIITGEGCLDGQTVFSKAPQEILKIGKGRKILLAGSLGYGYTQFLASGDVTILPLRGVPEGLASLEEIQEAIYQFFRN